MTQKSSNSGLTIDLEKDANLDFGSTIQEDASSGLRHLITAQLDEASYSYNNNKPTDITYPRPHRAILVEGGRGSGKTTFLLTHLQSLAGKCATGDLLALPAEWQKIASQVHVLPMVDPTLIEAKDNIIIIIIQMIEAAIDAMNNRQDDATERLDKAREELAEGLNLLDGIGSDRPYGEQWQGAAWVMSEGLRKARKGRNFELKFNLYLEAALSIFKKDAFILAFDDVDTNFKHGYLILETLRKYLTSPKLIIILSGDLDLYGRLIRKHIYETFGDKILRHDAGITQGQGIKEAVRELEEQYLLKVLPPKNRISMLPLGTLPNARGIMVKSLRSKNRTASLSTWMTRRVSAILGEPRGALNDTDHPFVSVICREHIRLVISYLRALDLALDESGEGSVADALPAALQASRSAVFKVFETRMRMAGVRSDLLDLQSFNATLRAVFEWLVRQQEPATLAKFGVPADANEAIVSHCLAAALAQGLERPGNALRALLTLLLPAMMLARTDLADGATRQDVFAFMNNRAAPLLTETTARIGAVARFQQERALTKQSASSFGSVGVVSRYSLHLRGALQRVYGYNQKPSPQLDDLVKTSAGRSSIRWLQLLLSHKFELQLEYGVVWFGIDELLRQRRCGEYGGVLSLVLSRRFNERGEVVQSISALSLLAVIAELLMQEDWLGYDGLAFQGIIPSFSPSIQSSAPFGNAGKVKREDKPDVEDEQDEPESTDETDTVVDASSTHYCAFTDRMKAWHAFARHLAQREKLAPSMLGVIAARIHDDLIDLDEVITQKWGAGEILHRQITNILNVFVYETAKSKGRKESPKTSDLPLINALRREPAGLHPLAIILLTCPLIWAFLLPGGYLRNELEMAADEALDKWLQRFIPEEDLAGFDGMWMYAPDIEVDIGRGARNPRKVTVAGFYDLLNVVPRYADDK